jgi:glycerol uptake facilitator-like aquaporin
VTYEPLSEPTVRRAGVSRGTVGAEEEARLEESIRRGARRAMDEKEQEESGGGGLYGSQIDASHILGAAIAELVGTFILVFVVMAVATDQRPPAAIAPVAVGFALAVGVFIAGPVTGGSVNPARSLGPMIVAGDLSSVWLYVLGPIIGGVLGALLYDRTMAQTQGPA